MMSDDDRDDGVIDPEALAEMDEESEEEEDEDEDEDAEEELL